MSYQQGGYQQAGYGQQGYQQSYPVAPRSSGLLLMVGIVLVIVGVVAGGALFFTGSQRYTSKVKSLALDSGALSGCVTDLTVTEPGTYTLFYISRGDLRINGANDGCASSDVVPIAADPEPPEISLKITNSSDKTLKLFEPDTLREIRSDGVVAVPYKQVKIGVVGSFRIEIAAPETGLPFAIGMGRDINKSSNLPAIVVGLAGIVFGIGFALLGLAQGGSSRRRYPQAYPAGPAQQPVGQYPGYAPGQYPQQPGAPMPPAQAPPIRRPAPGAPGQAGPGQAGPVQRPPVQRAAGAPGAPGAPRPGGAPVARPAAPPVQRPAAPQPMPGQRDERTQDLPPTIRQPQAGGAPAPRPAGAPVPPQRPAGGGLPRIVSSEDESGSLSTSPPTRPMPATPPSPRPAPGGEGWERPVPGSEPTRPVSSQRPEADFDPDEDLD